MRCTTTLLGAFMLLPYICFAILPVKDPFFFAVIRQPDHTRGAFFSPFERGASPDVLVKSPFATAVPDTIFPDTIRCEYIELDLRLRLDKFGSETRWALVGAKGDTLYREGPYDDSDTGRILSRTLCVPEGCYDFIIYDKYEDGICCEYGFGFYYLSDSGGRLLASGGEFSDMERSSFCVTKLPPCEGYRYFLDLTLDFFGRETTWSLTDDAGRPIREGGPYENRKSGLRLRDTFCLPEGCYNFRIRDSYGDGICCTYGDGSFALYTEGGDTLAEGSDYGYGTSARFCTPGAPAKGDTCHQINFKQYDILSHGGLDQDQGTGRRLTRGGGIAVFDNGWKAIPFSWKVTPNTMLAFDFRSGNSGEIHGIGFDNDSIITESYLFRVFGTQNWGIAGFDSYTGDNQWLTFIIPVGKFYTGDFNRLVFAADDDANKSCESFFRYVRVFEGSNSDCLNTDLPDDENLVRPVLNGAQPAKDLEIFPNPADQEVIIQAVYPKAGPEILTIYDALGRSIHSRSVNMEAGENRLPVDVSQLRPGLYRLQLQHLGRSALLTVQH